jgi:hypothetical protein
MASTDLGLYVLDRPFSDALCVHEIDDIARELEVLL